MRILPFATLALGSIVLAAVLASAAQEKKGAEKGEKHEARAMAAADLVNSETAKYAEAIPGVSRAIISGDPDKGAYRAFTKFAPGSMHPMHSHPNEIWIVVLKGAYIPQDRVRRGDPRHPRLVVPHPRGREARELGRREGRRRDVRGVTREVRDGPRGEEGREEEVGATDTGEGDVSSPGSIPEVRTSWSGSPAS
jgi:hypothetical protein